MNRKEVLELKRRLKKDACTITRMCGCYVDGERNRVVKLSETFLNLEEEELYKYLEIAKKRFPAHWAITFWSLPSRFRKSQMAADNSF